jgi:KUP system potassium uptake protein
MNYLMLFGCIALAIGFGSSSAIAAAYGIAVTGTMIITSLLFWVVARRLLGWGAVATSALVALFLFIDVSFFAANAVKLAAGGWFPLAVGAVVFAMMTTWHRGRQLFAKRIAQEALPLDVFLQDLQVSRPHRVAGTAVFMTSNIGTTPIVLLHYFKHSKVLHDHVVLFTVANVSAPKVEPADMVDVRPLGDGFWQVVARVGFMQDPNVPAILEQACRQGLTVGLADVSYYLGRETVLSGGRAPMARWRKGLFAFLSRNARPATQFFHLPPNRVVELGAQIEL